MPKVFRISCERCRPTTPQEPGCAGAVVIDGGDGLVTQGWYRAVLAEDGRIEPMRHPVEHEALRATGFTAIGASLRGRLFMVTQVLCDDCGALSERTAPDAFSAEAGCLLFILVPPALFLAGVRDFLPLFLGFIGAVVVAHLLLLGLVRIVHRCRAGEHRFQGCPACGSKEVVAVPSAGKRRFPCPNCRQRSVRITLAGIS